MRRGAFALALVLSGCSGFTDPATRLAYDLENANGELGARDGARYTLLHAVPSAAGECEGPYKVQLDQVGAIIVWCYDEAGNTVSSHSTSYHRNFADTPRTIILDKPAGETLRIELVRRNGRAAIVGAS
jgi:hypothetical protein